MPADTTHIRVLRATKAALERWAAEHGSELEEDWAPGEDGRHVSTDAVITELLRRDEAHRTRARAARRRRRTPATSPAEQTLQPAAPSRR